MSIAEAANNANPPNQRRRAVGSNRMIDSNMEDSEPKWKSAE